MRRKSINILLAGAVVVGAGAVVAGLVVNTGPATTPSTVLAEPLAPLPTPTALPQPPPVDIPAGIPSTLTVQGPAGILIDHVRVDQNLLHDGGNGVVPGDDPGLFVKPDTSVLPATNQNGTVIIGCHAYADNPKVCNPLNRLVQDDIGKSQVILSMPGGELVYVVEAILLVDKIDLPTQHALADNRPGRVEIITCDIENGNDTFQNRIVVACNASHSGCGVAA
jgi:hypothetical protein